MTSSISGRAALVGVGETDYVRGADKTVPELVLDASMAAITDAGLTPADVDGIIPPPRVHLQLGDSRPPRIPEVRHAVTVHMGGASPPQRCRARRWRCRVASPAACS